MSQNLRKIKSFTYVSKNPGTLSNKDAKVFGPIIENLKREDGKIYEKDILEEAKKEFSPLHNWERFDWTSAAIDKYNLMQAYELRISIDVEVYYEEVTTKTYKARIMYKEDKEPSNAHIRTLPAFSNTTPFNKSIKDRKVDGPGGSITGQDILLNPEYQKKLLVDFAYKLKSLLKLNAYLFEDYPDIDIQKITDVYEYILKMHT